MVLLNDFLVLFFLKDYCSMYRSTIHTSQSVSLTGQDIIKNFFFFFFPRYNTGDTEEWSS